MAVKRIAMVCLLGAVAGLSAADLPGQRLGRPLRIHIARGLWWQMLRLHETVGCLGGAELTTSVDVYGSPAGYHGCGRALGTFPKRPRELAQHDLIVVAGARLAPLSADEQSALLRWVEAGGGLLITGGPLCLDLDRLVDSPLAAALPTSLAAGSELARVVGDTRIRPAPGRVVEGFDWSTAPRLYWRNAGATPRADSEVLLQVSDLPVLLRRRLGRGAIAVFTGTVCGVPDNGETAFWDWPDWPRLLAAILTDLAPATAPGLPPPDEAAQAAAAQARAALAELGEAAGDLFADAFGEAATPASSDLGQRLAALSRLACTTEDTSALVRVLKAGDARLSFDQAEAICEALALAPPPDLGEAGFALMASSAPGTVACGLHLAGRAGQQQAGDRMLAVFAGGSRSLRSPAASILDTRVMEVPDGQDERLRLAAAQALADLADPRHAAPLRQALAQWQRGLSPVPTLAALRRDVEEAAMAALARMGDADAAAWLVDRYVTNGRDRETATDISEMRSQNASPADLQQRQNAHAEALALASANRRLLQALTRIPATTWPALAPRAAEWSGEFATQALLATLARGGRDHGPVATAALADIGARTRVPAIRRLCEAGVPAP